MEQEKKNIKVDAYDFFGYLIPGFILLAATSLLHLNATSKLTLDSVATIAWPGVSGYQFFSALSAIVIFSYVLGHIVASIASFFYEKIIIRYIFGYPYRLLVLAKKRKQSLSSNYFRALAVLFYAVTLCFILMPTEFKVFIFTNKIIILVLLGVLTGLCISSEKLASIIIYPFSKAFIIAESGVCLFVGQNRPLPTPVRKAFAKNFEECFQISPSDIESEVFWAVYWKVTQSDSYIRAKIDKWLILYSFMRNLGCALLISAIILSVQQALTGDVFIIKTHALVAYVLSVILIIRYYYLYYSYYSKSIFRVFVYLAESRVVKQEVSE